jgi:hypothetical protein
MRTIRHEYIGFVADGLLLALGNEKIPPGHTIPFGKTNFFEKRIIEKSFYDWHILKQVVTHVQRSRI